MNLNRGNIQYSSVYIVDNEAGFFGFELHCASDGKTQRIASVIYWDACGQYFLETFGSDVPVDILEVLIEEAREHYRSAEQKAVDGNPQESAIANCTCAPFFVRVRRWLRAVDGG